MVVLPPERLVPHNGGEKSVAAPGGVAALLGIVMLLLLPPGITLVVVGCGAAAGGGGALEGEDEIGVEDGVDDLHGAAVGGGGGGCRVRDPASRLPLLRLRLPPPSDRFDPTWRHEIQHSIPSSIPMLIGVILGGQLLTGRGRGRRAHPAAARDWRPPRRPWRLQRLLR